MDAFTTMMSAAILLPQDDVDTDQIIPARFLKATDRDGFGEQLFFDWRYGANGEPIRDFPLNQPEARRAKILVAGENFGCGSSREHAVWALTQFGFRAVIAKSFSDIFRGNALKNGLLPIELSPHSHAELHQSLTTYPDAELEIDLGKCEVSWPGGLTVRFEIDPFARECLLSGKDELERMLEEHDAIEDYERKRERLLVGLA